MLMGVALILAAMQPMSLADATSGPQELAWFEPGPAAALVHFTADDSFTFELRMEVSWSGKEYDSPWFGHIEERRSGFKNTFILLTGSTTPVGEALVRVGGVGDVEVYLDNQVHLLAGVYPPANSTMLHHPTLRLSGFHAGEWVVLMGLDATRPIHHTAAAVTFENISYVDNQPVRKVGVSRLMESDSGGIAGYSRHLSLGASVAVHTSKVVEISDALYGFSWYAEPGNSAGTHAFSVEGPSGTQPADDLVFLGEPSGTYTFRHDGVSGGEWPGHPLVYWIDTDLW